MESSAPIAFTEETVALGPVGIISPINVQFAETDKALVTFLYPDASGARQLYAVDTAAGSDLEPFLLLDSTKGSSKELSLVEQLQRERMRLFGGGLASYQWTDRSSNLRRALAPINGQFLLYDSQREAEAERLMVVNPMKDVPSVTNPAVVDPHIAPSGLKVAFVCQGDLYVVDTPADVCDPGQLPAALRLTVNGEKPGVTCGLADYVAQEEMNRYRGFWWSPDSSMIAYTEVDESHVPEYEIRHQGKADPHHTETHRYPFAGAANPSVKLAVLRADSAGGLPQSVWMDLVGSEPSIDAADYYVARVGWWADGSVMAQVQDRDQSVLQLLRLDPLTGQRTVLLEERSSVWVNIHDMLYCFPEGWEPSGLAAASEPSSFYFLWASERSGFSQLYLYKYTDGTAAAECLLGGAPVGPGGHWVVDTIDDVDFERELVYYSGNRGDPAQRHLFVCSFRNTELASEALQLTQESGWHAAAVSAKQGVAFDCFNSLETPHTVRICRITVTLLANGGLASASLQQVACILDGSKASDKARFDALTPLLKAPSMFTVPCTNDASTNLVCAAYIPDSAIHGPGPYPTIISVYGGPHVQMVCHKWLMRVDLRAQLMASRGYLVLKCDNRGSTRRGIAFEGAMRWDMGNLELQDQQAVVAHMVSRGLADAERVGIYGWSYGGYMSAMAVFRAKETFRCAVAGAPVTSWDGYDTHYTERYMGLPSKNPEGYINSSVMHHVPSGLTDRHLLLVHGLIDENVHFRHTARLVNALTEKRFRYDLVLFPCGRHGPSSKQDRAYLEERIASFFAEHLRGPVSKRKPEFEGAEQLLSRL